MRRLFGTVLVAFVVLFSIGCESFVEEKSEETVSKETLLSETFSISVVGNGYLVLEKDGGLFYTKGDTFEVADSGNIVVEGTDYILSPSSIVVLEGEENDLNITNNGDVTISGDVIASLELATFANPVGLVQVTGSVYAVSAESGAPSYYAPGEHGLGTVLFQ